MLFPAILAVVTTSSGDITSRVDARGHHNVMMPYGAGGVKKIIEAHTTDEALTVEICQAMRLPGLSLAPRLLRLRPGSRWTKVLKSAP